MPVSEVPSAIRTGVVDGFFVSLQSYVNLDLVKDAPYVVFTGTGLGFLGIWLSINKDSFNKLPKEWQEMILEEGRNAQVWYLKNVQEENVAKKQEAIGKGAKFLELTPQNIAAWRKIVQPIYDDLIEEHGAPMRDFVSKVDAISGSSFAK
jgi:TRAP-type C4-dicarboxylate transport system substrate-binding protein